MVIWVLYILHDGIIIVIHLFFGGSVGRGGGGRVGGSGEGAGDRDVGGCDGGEGGGYWGCIIVVWMVADGHCFKNK